jgi:predicted NUDIX family phosphoesterase
MGEMVYVINATGLERMPGLFHKRFSKDITDWVGFTAALLDGFFMEREEAEHQDAFKQIIPYVIFSSTDDKYLCYQRQGSEQRLVNGYSVGVGGHINPIDAEGIDYKADMVWRNIGRELVEELDIRDYSILEFIERANFYGLIYDPSNDVGKVHLGVVYLIDVDRNLCNRFQIKDEGKKLAWLSRSDLQHLGDHLESWSRLCLDLE